MLRAHGPWDGVLLANHGPVVAGDSLEAAVFAIEELEETARLWLLAGRKPEPLTPEQIDQLRQQFGASW